jgi:hypothetical protein
LKRIIDLCCLPKNPASQVNANQTLHNRANNERISREEAFQLYQDKKAKILNPNLRNALQRERLFGVSTNNNVDSKTQLREFTHPWILVEEFSGNYKPIICREYAETLPQIYKNYNSAKPVFCANSNPDDQTENAAKVPALHNSVASGLRISQTTAPHEKKVRNPNAILKLHNRIADLKNSKENINSNNRTSVKRKKATKEFFPRKRSKKKRHLNVCGMNFYTQPGYCENCCEKYDELGTHLKVFSL